MFTSHGHQIFGTPIDEDARIVIVGCGGPEYCRACRLEVEQYHDTKYIPPQSQTGLNVEFAKYMRKPFMVEATEVTTENIGEIAQLIGTLRTKDDGALYIQVDRRLIPNVFRVYPGFWVTKMGDNIRCYSKRIFMEQFVEGTAGMEDWVRFVVDKPNRNVFEPQS